jgi:hypothetical protein
VILAAVGWALVFRSGIGLLLGGTLVPLLLVGIAAEERLLESEFGSVYVDYARHTWRLVPFVYWSVNDEAWGPSGGVLPASADSPQFQVYRQRAKASSDLLAW